MTENNNQNRPGEPFQTISLTCGHCKIDHTIKVTPADYHAWKSGQLIQNALPYLTPDDREWLITNLCPTCWDKLILGE